MKVLRLTEPDDRPVLIAADHVVRIRAPTVSDPHGAGAVIDMVEGHQAVKESVEDVAKLLMSRSAYLRQDVGTRSEY